MRKIITSTIKLSNLYLKELPDLSDVEAIGTFYCNNNNLTNLKGAPHTVGNNFFCHSSQLTNLEGAPITVKNSFYCHDNKLINLKGGPKFVGNVDTERGDYSCVGNNLSSLEGAPESVGWHFHCWNNPLTSLKGIPKYIGGIFNISYSLFDKFPESYIRSLSNIKGVVQYLKQTEFII